MLPFDSMLKLTPYPMLSALIWTVAALAALYLARTYFHQFIRALTRLIHNTLRLTSASVRLAEKRLERRTREILIEKGRQGLQRRLNREFHHIHSAVQKNLKNYAALHRQVSEIVTRFEEDQRQSMDVPPALPNWVPVIDAIAAIEHPGDTMVAKTLADIHASLERHHKTAIENYRSTSKTRHGILNKMLPRWLKLQKTLEAMERAVSALIDRSKSIDAHMGEYERIQDESDPVARAMLMSSLTQFLVSGLFLSIAVGGAVLNINLIALPVSEMVGGGNYIGPFKTSFVAAVVITTVELSLGVFIMEALGITRQFPIIGSLDDTKRSRMVWCLLPLLIVFAGLEASLALLRDRLVADMASLQQMLAGVEQAESPTRMIPALAQMILGFVLPFWIALGAIPLATFMSSSRSMASIAAAWSLRMISFALRLCGNVALTTGNLIIAVYDLIIFPTLRLENALSRTSRRGATPSRRRSGFGFLKKFKNDKNEQNPPLESGESRK